MSGYVYLIGSPLFGWYKIGKSKTPEIRINALGILLPFKLHVIGVWEAKNHHLLETTLHDSHVNSRINGEWFEFTKEEVKAVFLTLPAAACVYPKEGSNISLERFSNVSNDTKKSNKILGLRVQKLRGDFTDEYREAKRLEGVAKSKRKRELREAVNDNI